MNSKLLITVISGFAAIGSLFLFSSNFQPEQQSANITEAAITFSPSTTPKRFDLGSRTIAYGELRDRSSKRSNLGGALTPLPSPAPTSLQDRPVIKSTPTRFPTPSPATATTQIPVLTSTPSLSATPVPTPTPSPSISLGPSPSATTTPEQSGKINTNTADKQELEKITGVGPVIAQRIIDYRNKNGPFQTIEDIKKVNGIGDKTFEKMKNEITI